MSVVDFRVIAALIEQGHEHATVAHTGGGCATIFVGSSCVDSDGDTRYQLSIGPGSYGWDDDEPVLSDPEFYIGPDDHGDAPAFTFDDDATEGDVASITLQILDELRKGRDWLDILASLREIYSTTERTS